MAEHSVIITEDLERQREVIRRIVGAGVCAFVVIDAVEALFATRRRLGSAAMSWWTQIEHRERGRYQRAESEFLGRLLTPLTSKGQSHAH